MFGDFQGGDAAFQAGKVEQVPCHPLQPVQLALAFAQELGARIRFAASLALQDFDELAQGGQWRTQFV